VRLDKGGELEVTEPKEDDGDVEEKEGKGKGGVTGTEGIWAGVRRGRRLERLQCGGRQENSLGTIRSISQSLYTNTGWSVRSLG